MAAVELKVGRPAARENSVGAPEEVLKWVIALGFQVQLKKMGQGLGLRVAPWSRSLGGSIIGVTSGDSSGDFRRDSSGCQQQWEKHLDAEWLLLS